MSKTIELWDKTVIVVRQIAAVGPVVNKKKEFETEDEQPNPPPKVWCYFDIWLVGGTKLYPQLEYPSDTIEAYRDRTNLLMAIEGGNAQL